VRNPGATTRRRLVILLLAVAAIAAPVAGAAKPKAQKTIVVSVGQQMVWAYKGDKVVLRSYVSTGRAGFDTPVGSYAVLTKLPSQTMEGVIGGEYYNVPDVPWVLYFTNSGHALHGTYWHNSFGTPMSHGCVNLPLDVAAWLYDWAPVGTRVLIVA
jgi:lipoprotein-anchoring transpeptidase ErfK/SrfK